MLEQGNKKSFTILNAYFGFHFGNLSGCTNASLSTGLVETPAKVLLLWCVAQLRAVGIQGSILFCKKKIIFLLLSKKLPFIVAFLPLQVAQNQNYTYFATIHARGVLKVWQHEKPGHRKGHPCHNKRTHFTQRNASSKTTTNPVSISSGIDGFNLPPAQKRGFRMNGPPCWEVRNARGHPALTRKSCNFNVIIQLLPLQTLPANWRRPKLSIYMPCFRPTLVHRSSVPSCAPCSRRHGCRL